MLVPITPPHKRLSFGLGFLKDGISYFCFRGLTATAYFADQLDVTLRAPSVKSLRVFKNLPQAIVKILRRPFMAFATIAAVTKIF